MVCGGCPWFSDYWGGWACFTVSILGIGLLTALIGDLASGFGCTIGLKDSVTAISFVALGTSLPGRPKWTEVHQKSGWVIVSMMCKCTQSLVSPFNIEFFHIFSIFFSLFKTILSFFCSILHHQVFFFHSFGWSWTCLFFEKFMPMLNKILWHKKLSKWQLKCLS